jgi:uncharacterized protein (TIGR00255 family)
MLKSMTGFGKAISEIPQLTVTVEIKTLNSKFTDIFCRLPKSISYREIEVRNMLTQRLERGKIECIITVSRHAAEGVAVVNRSLLKSYIKELSICVSENSLTDVRGGEMLQMAMEMPEVLSSNVPMSDEQSQQEWACISQTIEQAIGHCEAFRKREGQMTAQKLLQYIGQIEAGLQEVIGQDERRIPAVRERLHKSVTELLGDEGFDKNRFEQELIYYIEKMDISEEKVRLKTHLDYFQEVIKEGNGKKLNFLSQEIGREINTIGSKANDAVIQRIVVNMKDELEKIKEQTMNIL